MYRNFKSFTNVFKEQTNSVTNCFKDCKYFSNVTFFQFKKLFSTKMKLGGDFVSVPVTATAGVAIRNDDGFRKTTNSWREREKEGERERKNNGV